MNTVQFIEGVADRAHVFSIATHFGSFAAAVDDDGALLALNFPSASRPSAMERIAIDIQRCHPECKIVNDSEAFANIALASQIQGFLSGDAEEFDLQVRPGKCTQFCLSVWKATAAIPYGQTMSYGELARVIGAERATRATGSALGKNPIPIVIPCHRVLGAHGCLGGFSGGLDWKRRLLELEKSRRPALV